VQLLTVSSAMLERLLARKAVGLFESAAVHGNSFAAMSQLFASRLLSFGGNSFLAEPGGAAFPYGSMVALRAAAAGNVALVNGENAFLRFLLPAGGGFSGAANQLVTQPPSLN
jgi:hypothetical protein